MSDVLRVDPTGYARVHDEVWVEGERKAAAAEIHDVDRLIAIAETAGRNIISQAADQAA